MTGIFTFCVLVGVGVRFSPIRAVTLALKSKLLSRVKAYSPHGKLSNTRRTQLLDLKWNLNNNLVGNNKNVDVIVVQGQKGVGKTSMVDTCVRELKGFVEVSVLPDTSESEVLQLCYNAILDDCWKSIFCTDAARVKRILFFHRLLFNQSPVVVLRLLVRHSHQQNAKISIAVNKLSEMGFKVIVDAGPNSLDPSSLTNYRNIIEIASLTKTEIRDMPHLQTMFETLDKLNLSSVVLDMLGGDLELYENLSSRLQYNSEHNIEACSVDKAVSNFLQAMLSSAAREVFAAKNSVFNRQQNNKLFAILRNKESVSRNEMLANEISFPTHSNILYRMLNDTIIPANQVVSLLLNHDCDHNKAIYALDQRIIKALAESQKVEL